MLPGDLSLYAPATPCPVQTWRLVHCGWYGHSTRSRISLCAHYTVSGTDSAGYGHGALLENLPKTTSLQRVIGFGSECSMGGFSALTVAHD
eukprot:2655586-Rhodomonas_salina.1